MWSFNIHIYLLRILAFSEGHLTKELLVYIRAKNKGLIFDSWNLKRNQNYYRKSINIGVCNPISGEKTNQTIKTICPPIFPLNRNLLLFLYVNLQNIEANNFRFRLATKTGRKYNANYKSNYFSFIICSGCFFSPAFSLIQNEF